MKSLILCLCFLFCAGSFVSAESELRTYSYENVKLTDDSVSNTFDLTIEDLPGGQTRFTRKTNGKDYVQTEVFVVNDEYDTVSWSTERADKETNYSGRKEGRNVIIEGVFNGEDISKTLVLKDDQPLYITPKFNLMNFVRSEEKEAQFWTLRKDKWTEYLMRAEKVEEKTVKMNEKDVLALKVKYQATGAGAKYYKRSYYYRLSDGMFLKRKKKAKLMRLISE